MSIDVHPADLIDERIHKTADLIRALIESQDAQATPEHWVIYHGQVTPDSEATIEVCVPFTGSVEPAGRTDRAWGSLAENGIAVADRIERVVGACGGTCGRT